METGTIVIITFWTIYFIINIFFEDFWEMTEKWFSSKSKSDYDEYDKELDRRIAMAKQDKYATKLIKEYDMEEEEEYNLFVDPEELLDFEEEKEDEEEEKGFTMNDLDT